MIDFHCHILPGIDDGSPDMETSLQMARISLASGVTHIVATPHGSSRDMADILQKRDEVLEALSRRLEEENIPIKLLPGLEYYADGHSADLNRVPLNARCGLPPYENRPILVELPMSVDVSFAENLLFNAQLAGMPVVLAHPSRYNGFKKHADMFKRLLERGMYLQFNAVNLVGGILFAGLAKTIIDIIKTEPDRVLLGSDAHEAKYRTTDMLCARKRVVSSLGEDIWNKITTENPATLLGIKEQL